MLLFSVTKRINKALAPKLLSLSLRLHEASVPAASSHSSPLRKLVFPYLSNRLLLPIAQRLISIEVQDDYLRISKGHHANIASSSSASSSSLSSSSWWDNFVDKTWSLFFQDYYERHTNSKVSLSSSSSTEQEHFAELQAQKLYKMKQKKRQERQRQRIKVDSRTTGQLGKIGSDNTYDDNHHNELLELGYQRVQVLDRYIRPALLSSVEGLHRPLFMTLQEQQQESYAHNNFVKWLRGEYLIAKYGLIVHYAVKQHPELRGYAHGDNTNDGIRNQLPSVHTVIQAFGLQHWNRQKAPIPVDEEEKDIDISSTNGVISLGRIIQHKLDGQIIHAGPLNAYFEMRRLWGRGKRQVGGGGAEDSCYELWTREYIFGLAQYLLDRIRAMDRNGHGPMETIILDVGAGDGRLSYYLRCAMGEIHHVGLNPKQNPAAHPTMLPTIVATDDGSWNSPMDRYNLNSFSPSDDQPSVERLSAIASLRKYGPNIENYKNRRLIVLCSWMPPGQDWTADFRRPLVDNDRKAIVSESGDMDDDKKDIDRRVVEEYILIGEADNGTCGHNWYTWGNPDFHTATNENTPPHSRDGYERVDLEELSVLQFSRFDCQRSSESKTVSFRRI